MEERLPYIDLFQAITVTDALTIRKDHELDVLVFGWGTHDLLPRLLYRLQDGIVKGQGHGWRGEIEVFGS